MQNAPRRAKQTMTFLTRSKGIQAERTKKREQIMQSYFRNIGIVFDVMRIPWKIAHSTKKSEPHDPGRWLWFVLIAIPIGSRQLANRDAPIFPRVSRDLRRFAQMRAKTAMVEKIRQIGRSVTGFAMFTQVRTIKSKFAVYFLFPDVHSRPIH